MWLKIKNRLVNACYVAQIKATTHYIGFQNVGYKVILLASEQTDDDGIIVEKFNTLEEAVKYLSEIQEKLLTKEEIVVI